MNNTLALFFLRIISTIPCDPDYYWRNYHGKIPPDAVEGGMDVMGHPTYIGQAFVLNHGILIGQIFPGQKKLTTGYEGLHVTDVYIRILCSGHKKNFSWIPVNRFTVHLTTINKHLVSGGMQRSSLLNIGRLKFKDELIVGKVWSETAGDTKQYLVDKEGEQYYAENYEILAYEKKPLCKSSLKHK